MEVPSRRQGRERLTAERMKGALAAAGLAITGCTQPNIEFPDPNPVKCEVSDDTQEFTFESGQGVNDAIIAIEGSGGGEGAACWPEAKVAVKDQLSSRLPQDGETIDIPVSVEPVKSDNQQLGE